jgi:hypothetical protein
MVAEYYQLVHFRGGELIMQEDMIRSHYSLLPSYGLVGDKIDGIRNQLKPHGFNTLKLIKYIG